MNNKLCVDCLIYLRDMFIVGGMPLPCEDDGAPPIMSALNYAINFINNAERLQGEWIPIGEGLPEEKLLNPSGSDLGFDFEEVLCSTVWGDIRAYKFGKPVGHDKPHFWYDGKIMDDYVIAWQPPIEPYKENEDGHTSDRRADSGID